MSDIREMSADHLLQLIKAQESFQANSAARSAVGARVEGLSEQIRVIESVMKQIQTISTQVSMLSINASIEAARAGVAGKGFAVVAQEVGRLAQSTSSAVVDIDSGIRAMNDLIAKTSGDMGKAKKIGAEFDLRLDGCVESARKLDERIKDSAGSLTLTDR